MKRAEPVVRRGRPRAFDAEAALDAAVAVFWRNGYEGTSLSDLTDAMGINRPSLYAAFGNKEALFRKAIDRYVERGNRMVADAMAAPTAREAVERLLRSTAGRALTANPKGCLLVGAALSCGAAAEPIRQELALRRGDLERHLRQRCDQARADGELSAAVDVAALAKFYATVMHGMAVQSAGGAGRAELGGVVDAALRAWPAPLARGRRRPRAAAPASRRGPSAVH